MTKDLWQFIASGLGAIGSLILFQGIENTKVRIGAICVFAGFLITAFLYAINITDVQTKWFVFAVMIISILYVPVPVIITYRKRRNNSKVGNMKPDKPILEMTEKELRLSIREEVMHSLLNTLPKTVDAIEARIKLISSNGNSSSP